MNQKERLVELCDNVITSCKSSLCEDCEHNNVDYPNCMSVHFADKILADGWMRPPVKVGNKVYIVAEVSRKVVEATVIGFWMYEDNVSIITDYGTIHHNSIGKTVFTSREEAEKALGKEGI